MKRRLFYGWVIVAAGCAVMAVAMGLVSNAFGIFIVPVCREFGFTRQQMNFNLSLFMIGSMVVALFGGAIFGRFPVKRILRLGAVVLCASYFCYPLAKSLPVFYLLTSVCAVTFALVTQMPLSILLNNWFHEKRGLAVGITFMGSGLGGMIFNALGGALLSRMDWRLTMVVFGACLTAVLLPCVFFLLKTSPSEMGLQPLGQMEGVPPEEPTGPPLSFITRSAPFWAAIASIICFGTCMNSVNAVMASHLSDSGYSASFAASATAVYLGCLALGKITLGALFDKLPLRKAMLIAHLCLVAELFCMVNAGRIWGLVGALTLSGLGNAFGTVSYPVLARTLYGSREYPSVTGFFMSANSLGSAIGPTVCGAVYDATGSYNGAFIVMAAGIAVVAVALNLTAGHIQSLRSGWGRAQPNNEI